MKKRLLSVIMALCLMLTTVPSVLAAETEPKTGTNEAGIAAQADGAEGGSAASADVAAIGETAYSSLEAAFQAAQGESSPATITLTGNASVTSKIVVSSDVTLDAGSYTVTGVTGSADVYFEITGGTLTVNGGTFTAFGDTAGTVTGAGVFKIPAGSTAAIAATGVTVERFNRAAFDVRSGSFELTNCTIDCNNGQGSRLTKGVVAGYDASGKVSGKITGCKITGADSTYEGWSANGIEISSGATVTAANTEITSMKGGISVARNYGSGKADVTVTDCTINAKDYALRIFESNNSQDAAAGTSAELKVNGGSYTGDVRISLKDDAETDGSSTISITGGTFSGITTDGFEAFVPAGCTVAEENGSYTVAKLTADHAQAAIGSTNYATLGEAINAAKDGDTVKLLSSVTLTEKLAISKSITLDGGGKTITGKNDSAEVYIEITGKNVTVQNLKVKDFGGSTMTTSQWGLFKVPENAGTELTAKNVTASNFNRAAFDIRSGSFELDGCVIDCANESTSKLTKGVLAQDVSGEIKNTTITNAETTYTEEGNAWNTNAVETWGNTTLTISGCTLGTPSAVVKNGVSMNTGSGSSTVTISDTTIMASNRIVKLTPDNGGTGTSALTIKSGSYSGTFLINQGNVAGKGCTITVEGGSFTDNPGAYAADGLAAAAKTNVINGVTYYYTIGKKTVDVDTAVAAGEPAVTIPDALKETLTEDSVKSALNAEETVKSLGDAAANLTNDPSVVGTEKDAKQALEKAGITVDENATVTVVVEPCLDVKINSYDNGILKLDISAFYNVKATTADLSDPNAEMDNTNTVTMASGKPMTVTTPVTVTIPLPAGFAADADTVWVKHMKGSGKTYYHQGTISEGENGVRLLSFVNNKGFSAFEVTTTAAPVASIGDTSYGTLQEAVDEVKDGQTIKMLADGSAAVSKAISFTVETNGKTANISAGSGYTMTKTDAGVYTFKKNSGGSSGGGSSSGGSSSGGSSGGGSSSGGSYSVDVPAGIKGGSVSVNPKNAAKGSTVTVTVTPDKGYTLETLTVLDKDGKELKLTEKDGKYTFTMPAGKVSVKASFMEDNAMLNFFADVPASAYYYDAVLWAAEKGVTGGTSAVTFSPDSPCTRAQIVTFLWRAAGSPEPKALSSFTDVPADAYYVKAVAWAVENGITTGTVDGRFDPNAPCTRAQAVTFLHRASGAPAASGAGFSDVAADAYYAAAVAWASANGVTSGTKDGGFSPNTTCTRAQIVTFLWRAYTK